jgi:ubiquinone biosynthesis protein
MEFMDGNPDSGELADATSERKQVILDRGAEAIIRMLYKDGFFHADLHPGNLMIMADDKIGFIDLGMVGRFQDRTRRRMLYYFHALVSGDIEGATRNLTAMARIGKNGDPNGFRRSVTDLLRRFYQHASYGDFSLGQLIVNSLAIGGRHRVFFPVEMTLMTKALITYEGVGKMLNPKIDIPELSRKHALKIFQDQFHPASIARELWRGTPELIDVIMRLPRITADSLNHLEDTLTDRTPRPDSIQSLSGSIMSGAFVLAGTLAVVQGGPWPLWRSAVSDRLRFSTFSTGSRDDEPAIDIPVSSPATIRLISNISKASTGRSLPGSWTTTSARNPCTASDTSPPTDR